MLYWFIIKYLPVYQVGGYKTCYALIQQYLLFTCSKGCSGIDMGKCIFRFKLIDIN